jgi:hypothetical protein
LELHRRSLKEAVEDLPFFLGSSKIALDDDEVVSFTQNGGWQKVDKILPLLFSGWLHESSLFESWISHLQNISDRLKVSHPFLRRGSL